MSRRGVDCSGGGGRGGGGVFQRGGQGRAGVGNAVEAVSGQLSGEGVEALDSLAVFGPGFVIAEEGVIWDLCLLG